MIGPPRTLRARWILPIDRPPIANGWISIQNGRIAGLGPGRPPDTAEDLGDVAVLPGLINAHTHLELSWMQGLVPPASSMPEWIQQLMRVRRSAVLDGDTAKAEAQTRVETDAMARAIADMRATGTIAVGDISNTLGSARVLRAAGMNGIIFHEILGFGTTDPEQNVAAAWARVDALAGECPDLEFSVVAHAPYSVSPALFRAIALGKRGAPLAIHLGESPEEMEFVRDGTGPMRAMLERFGVWSGAWQPGGVDPAEYIDRLGYLSPGCLVVHGVHLPDRALARLLDRRAVLVTCPRSNIWVGGGSPPIERFYASGVPVALGTDSLASVATLNLFDEMAEARRLAPGVASSRILESATRVGAEALGLGGSLGTLTPGKRAALTVVEMPVTDDVEEYLLCGIRPEAVRVY